MHNILVAGHDSFLRIVDGASFNGSSKLTTGGALTGQADGKTGLFSCWLKTSAFATQTLITSQVVGGGGIYIRVFNSSQNWIAVSGYNSSGTEILAISSNYIDANWVHVLASWDLASGIRQLYINDVSDIATDSSSNDTIDYDNASPNWAVGGNTGAGSNFDGGLADLYFAPNQYLDISALQNRRKFISSSKKPAHLGTTGASPTGTAPLVYLHLDNGEAAANFATNRGTGGNFSITGSLSTASDSPSD